MCGAIITLACFLSLTFPLSRYPPSVDNASFMIPENNAGLTTLLPGFRFATAKPYNSHFYIDHSSL